MRSGRNRGAVHFMAACCAPVLPLSPSCRARLHALPARACTALPGSDEFAWSGIQGTSISKRKPRGAVSHECPNHDAVPDAPSRWLGGRGREGQRPLSHPAPSTWSFGSQKAGKIMCVPWSTPRLQSVIGDDKVRAEPDLKRPKSRSRRRTARGAAPRASKGQSRDQQTDHHWARCGACRQIAVLGCGSLGPPTPSPFR